MKVLVTGATGFVGSHVAAGLVAAGHDVRLLARSPERVPSVFAPLGPAPTDVVHGDVLDAAAVRRAVEGCDAVVHAAAVFSLDPHDQARVLATNEEATRLVLGTAVAAGADPVVHVSSTVVLARRGGSGPDLPLGDLDQTYARSKIASERVARDLQAQGAAVTIVYPGAVHGPHDPYCGEQATRLSWVARGRLPVWPRGGIHATDVRDVARVVVAATEPGQGPRRYVVPGHHMTGPWQHAAVASALGRRRPVLTVPAGVMEPMTRGLDALMRRLPETWRVPVNAEGPDFYGRDTRLPDDAARTDLGVTPIPLETSIRDTIAWLVDAGHLPRRYRPR